MKEETLTAEEIAFKEIDKLHNELKESEFISTDDMKEIVTKAINNSLSKHNEEIDKAFRKGIMEGYNELFSTLQALKSKYEKGCNNEFITGNVILYCGIDNDYKKGDVILCPSCKAKLSVLTELERGN